MAELQSAISNGCHVKTIVNPTTSYTFSWTVENLSRFELEKEKKSPMFHPRLDLTFYATLRLNGNANGFLKFYLVSEASIKVNHNVTIEDSAGQILLKHTTLYKYSKASQCDVLPNCPDVMKKARAENVLIFKCVMELYGKEKTDAYHYKSLLKPVSPLDDLSALSKDLQAMFDTSTYADINLEVDGSIVRVHKSIMAARSPVFAKMFETSMEEKKNNVVVVKDLQLTVLKDLVSYLYTGVMDKDDFESVYALFYAADKYDVACLRKKCVDVLLSKLDVENSCRVLVLADQHSDIDLKKSAMEFIKFYFNDVRKTDAWKELVDNRTHLLKEFVTL